MKQIIAILISGFLYLCSAAVNAGAIGFTFSGGTAQSGESATYGFQFTPFADILVDGLGFFDQDVNGLSTGHEVGIWNSTGTLLASTTVNTGNSAAAGPIINDGRFRFTPIPDLLLQGGLTYTLGANEEGSSDTWYSGVIQIGNASLASVSSIGYFTLGAFAEPVLTTNDTYGIGSFTARLAPVAPVPEPATLALLALGLAGLGFSRRRQS